MTAPERAVPFDSRVLRILQRFVTETRDTLAATDAMVWLLHDDQSILMPLASAQTPEELFTHIRIHVDDSVIGLVAQTGMPTVIGPEDQHNPLAEEVSGIATEWMVAAPVYVHGEVRGVLSAIQSDRERSFSGEDLETIAWRAELLGSVLQVGLEPRTPA